MLFGVFTTTYFIFILQLHCFVSLGNFRVFRIRLLALKNRYKL